MAADGTTTRRPVDVPARSRRTVDLSTVPELAGTSFSTVLESDRAVALDRLVTLDPAGRATSVATAIDEPSTTWSLRRGRRRRGRSSCSTSCSNPGDADTRVQVRYLPAEGGSPIVRTHTVAAHSRSTIWVDREEPSLAAAEVAAEITQPRRRAHRRRAHALRHGRRARPSRAAASRRRRAASVEASDAAGRGRATLAAGRRRARRRSRRRRRRWPSPTAVRPPTSP